MADLNVCTFTGHLTKDATIDVVGAKGTQITKFDIANNTGFGTYAKTNFFHVQIWGKAGAAVVQYLTKGKQVAVTGTLENDKWTGQDGQSHDSWKLTANSVTLLGGGNNNKEQATPTETVTADQVTF